MNIFKDLDSQNLPLEIKYELSRFYIKVREKGQDEKKKWEKKTKLESKYIKENNSTLRRSGMFRILVVLSFKVLGN